MDLARTADVIDHLNKIENPHEAIIVFLLGRLNAIGVELEATYNRIRGPGKELPKLNAEQEEGLVERIREHESLLEALAKIVQKTKIKDVALGQRYLNLYSDFLLFKAVFTRATQIPSGAVEPVVRGGEEDAEQPAEPNPTRQETPKPEEEQCQVPAESTVEEPEAEKPKRRSTRNKNKK